MSTGTPVVVSRIQNRRGTQAQFDALYPTYPGTGPNILQPGEIALCTDTKRMFVGNLNGEYFELGSTGLSDKLVFQPNPVILPPSATWNIISGAMFDPAATPFYNILYSVTDAPLSGILPAPANLVGTFFSKNGELKITAIVDPLIVGFNSVALTDTGTEINSYGYPLPSPYDINFKADYDVSGNIQISYMHNFPVALTFSTSSIIWVSI